MCETYYLTYLAESVLRMLKRQRLVVVDAASVVDEELEKSR